MIKRNIKGQFDKGTVAGNIFTRETSLGNQHAKGNPPNITSFKKDELVGKKSYNWKGGHQKLKEGYYIWLGSNKRKKRARYIWELENGEIEKGMVIYHRDGDKYNDAIENLEKISRAELVRINRHN